MIYKLNPIKMGITIKLLTGKLIKLYKGESINLRGIELNYI